jgi:four helix bundle protein
MTDSSAETDVRAGFLTWEEQAPVPFRTDPVWSLASYWLSLYLADLAWSDVSLLYRDARARRIAGQLYEAVGSVGANIAEGYSRGSAKDRARFYEYALGSARESRDWYYKSRHLLGSSTSARRFILVSRITQLLLRMVQDQRGYSVREVGPVYGVDELRTPSRVDASAHVEDAWSAPEASHIADESPTPAANHG